MHAQRSLEKQILERHHPPLRPEKNQFLCHQRTCTQKGKRTYSLISYSIHLIIKEYVWTEWIYKLIRWGNLNKNELRKKEDLRGASQGARYPISYPEKLREKQQERKKELEEKKNNPQEDMLFIQK